MSAPCPTLGFRLIAALSPAAGEGQRAALRAAFVHVLSANGLVGEAEDGGAFAYTVTGDGTQATESDRARIAAWLDEQPVVDSWHAGPLTDVTETV